MENEIIKLLLVEDNADDALLIKRKLDNSVRARFRIHVTTTLANGLSFISSQPPDLILADLGLPDSRGLQTVYSIMADAPHIPLVVLSGFDDEATAIKAVQAGAQDYLVKGQIDNPQLERSLYYSIERARLQNEIDKHHKRIISFQTNLYKVLDKNADAILVIDEDKHVLFSNPAAGELMGRSQKDLLKEEFNYMLMPGKTEEIEIIQPDKTKKTAEMSVVDIDWEGSPAYLISIHEITQRKQMEDRLRQIDQMKSEFLSNVSHELRTPLQSISGFTKLILNGEVPDKQTQQEFLQIIDRETAHLGYLINSLLDMSHLESGRFQINRKAVALRHTVMDALQIFDGLARQKKIRLCKELSENIPETEVDKERIRQVIINLVGNAIKFSDPGSSIKIRAGVKKGEFFFEVTDHGTGIREKNMKNLFHRFYREEGETARGGTGLGLFISKQIVEAHGGRIQAESKYGEGSTFRFTLPLNAKGVIING